MAEETEIKKKGHRGGRREGAGRKPKYVNGKVYSISLGDEVAEILEKQPNRSDFVAQLILQWAAQNAASTAAQEASSLNQ